MEMEGHREEKLDMKPGDNRNGSLSTPRTKQMEVNRNWTARIWNQH